MAEGASQARATQLIERVALLHWVARVLGVPLGPYCVTLLRSSPGHPAEVEAFRGGKNKLQGFFVGQLMKQTGGRADPKLANQILMQKLKG